MNLSLFNKIHSFIAPLCQPPSPKAPNTQKLNKDAYINYINFYTLSFSLLASILLLFISSLYTWRLFILYSGLLSLMLVSFLLTCQSHPEIYQFTNTFILTLIGPAALAISKNNLFFALGTSLTAPSLILFLFQRKSLTCISFVLQFVFINLIYLPIYKDLMMTPILNDFNLLNDEAFNTFNFIFVINTVLIYAVFSINQDFPPAKAPEKGRASKSYNKILENFADKARSLLADMTSSITVAQLEEANVTLKGLLANGRACGGVLLSYLNNILDLIKIEEGGFQVNYFPERVIDVLERFWATSADFTKTKNLSGIIAIHKDVPPVLMLDQHRLYEVLISVLANAIRFTDKGHVGLFVTWVNKDIITDGVFEPIPYEDEEGIGDIRTSTFFRSIVHKEKHEDGPFTVFDISDKKFSDGSPINPQQLAPKKGILKITLSDTGSGMSERTLEDMFKNPYLNIEAQLEENKSVRGFNTWILNQICEKMNGKLKIYSKPSRGTTCIICLQTEVPASNIIENNPLLTVDISRPLPNRMRAILLDDNLCTLDCLKGCLQRSQVDIINSGRNMEKALETYEKELRQGRVIHFFAVNVHGSPADGNAIFAQIRQYEVSRNMQPCAIILLGECYSDTQQKEALGPNQEEKTNFLVHVPIYLPALQKVLANIQSTNNVEPIEPFHPTRVLIVDDMPLNVELLASILQRSNFSNLKAENGKTAVDVYKERWRDIAVIFMDCEMPVMDGYEATRVIRAFQQTKRIQQVKIFGVTGHVKQVNIFGVTGNARSEDEEKCKQAGMNGTIPKPVPIDQVNRIVGECLNEYQ